MLSDTRPTAAELRVMLAQAARVREQNAEREQVLDLPQPMQAMAVAS